MAFMIWASLLLQFSIPAAAATLLVVLLQRRASPKLRDPRVSLPGPSLRAYLPGGAVFALLADASSAIPQLSSLTRIHGATFALRVGLGTVAVVTSHADDLAHITSGSHALTCTPAADAAFDAAVPRSVMTMERAEQQAARRVLRAAFNHASLPRMHARIADAAADAVRLAADAVRQHDDAKNKKRLGRAGGGKPGAVADGSTAATVDASALLGAAGAQVILNGALGFELGPNARDSFLRSIDALTAGMLRELTQYPLRQMFACVFPPLRARMVAARAEIDALSRRFIRARLAEKAERQRHLQEVQREPDLLDAILALEDHDEDRCVAEVSAFVIAGTHTTVAAMTWALVHLARNPRVRDKLERELDSVHATDAGESIGSVDDNRGRLKLKPLQLEDMGRLPYLAAVWKETLRLTAPIAVLVRAAAADLHLKGSGAFVAAGTPLIAFLHGAHTSEAHYDDADSFVPERWGAKGADMTPTGAFLPFGAAHRRCPGEFLANYEGPLVIAELVRRFRFEVACPDEDVRNVTNFVQVPRWVLRGGRGAGVGVPMSVRPR